MLSSGKRAFDYASALLHGDIDNCKQDKKQMDLFQKILAVFNLWSFIWKRLKQSVLADHRGISLILLLNIFPKFISITTALSSIWWTWQMYCRCCCVIVLHASIDCSGHELKQQLQHLLSTQVCYFFMFGAFLICCGTRIWNRCSMTFFPERECYISVLILYPEWR